MLNKRGFSLIELVVTVAIAGIMFGLFGFSYYNSQEKNQLKNATTNLRSIIDYTRQSSLTGLIPADCSGPLFLGHGLLLNTSSQSITQVNYCLVGGIATRRTTDTFNLQDYPHIRLHSTSTTLGVYFTKINGHLIRSDGVSTSLIVYLRNTYSDSCSQIVVGNFGRITTNNDVSCP